MFDVRDKKILVVGLGISGYAVADLLARRGARVKLTESSDTDEIRQRLEKLMPQRLQFELGGHTEAFCRDVELVVASPGIAPQSLPLSVSRQRGIPVVGELEVGAWFCPAPIIAISGTNGKSTTTELTGKILSLSGRHTVICGNIGNPLSAEVDSITQESIAVVEVSSFQLETVKNFKPYIAVLLNISEDHYERHGSYERYRAEKFKIFKNQSAGDWALLHSDLRGLPITKDIKSRLLFFGAENGDATVDRSGAITVPDSGYLKETGRAAILPEVIMKTTDIFLEGKHNLDNVVCAALVCRIMGIDNGCIREAIMSFRGLEHRFKRIGEFGGVEFIDDSKATNVDATRRALESMDRKVVLIAGGRDKGGDYRSVLPVVREKVKAMVLIGEARERIRDIFSHIVPVFTADNMGKAVEIASGVALEGEAVLLSPMCSSFDMFSDYKERGKEFQREVRTQRAGDMGCETLLGCQHTKYGQGC